MSDAEALRSSVEQPVTHEAGDHRKGQVGVFLAIGRDPEAGSEQLRSGAESGAVETGNAVEVGGDRSEIEEGLGAVERDHGDGAGEEDGAYKEAPGEGGIEEVEVEEELGVH